MFSVTKARPKPTFDHSRFEFEDGGDESIFFLEFRVGRRLGKGGSGSGVSDLVLPCSC